MNDILTRIEGRAGRITLNRPDALNALSYDMCLAIEAALDAWRDDDRVSLVVLDAAGPRAFCAGGDIAEMYRTGTAGDFAYGQKFWRDEYRMNLKIRTYAKPVVSFMQGFTMGGGVGVGCHGTLRIVGETSQMAMPECGIGLVPDVGGTYLLARAPGRCGAYLALSSARMDGADAVHAGFADQFMQEQRWPEAISALTESGRVDSLTFDTPADSGLAAAQNEVDTLFAGTSLTDIRARLQSATSDFAKAAWKGVSRGSPLSQACTLAMLDRLGAQPSMQEALTMEYRFTARSGEHGDFLEGIRAQIIDKDRNPKWKHSDGVVPEETVAAMLAELAEDVQPLAF
jgi:enoyl-CoA hydratase/carnithine racemase